MVKKAAIATAALMSMAWLTGCGQRPVIEGNLVFVKYAQIYKYSEGKIMRLTRQGKNYEPEISPDGQWVAFTSIRDNKPKTEVYLMDINGKNIKQITYFIEGKGRGSYPRWKDNEHIFAAYSVNIPNITFTKEGKRVGDYWNPGINFRGKDVHFNGLARFSPDKRYRLAYSIFGGWGKYIRIIQSEDEEHGRELISLQPKETSPDPRFSPDSTRVLFTDGGDMKYYDIPAMQEVVVKRGKEGRVRYTDPCWSPDGKKIAVSKIYSYVWGFYQRSYVVIMNADGTDEQTIARGAQPDWGK